ncbi:MAG TPA: hypothetical protein VFI59_12450 [Actinomycetota bacterium]|nr:hypothetical protein [Actinomycetota bacterium]
MRRIGIAPVALVAALAAASALVGCGGAADDGAPTSAASPTVAVERPASTAELTIVRPENGDRVAGDTTQLEIDLQGAEVVDQTSTDLRPDEGHLHVMLDGKLVSMTSGTSQLLADLTPGEHLLQVEFVANDHAPFDPRVLAAVTFEAKG